MSFHVYILYSPEIDKYYVGYTSNALKERLRRHNTNHKGFTGKTNDWKLVYKESFFSKKEAYAREREIKKQKSRTYIEILISSV